MGVNLDTELVISDYSLKNCMFSWRMARTHLGKISANIKNSKYGAVFKHCFLGALEFIPIIGQIISLAERKLYLISMKSDICKQLPHADHMKNNLENLSVIDRISLLRECHFDQEILKKVIGHGGKFLESCM